jgi:hypothetical protein
MKEKFGFFYQYSYSERRSRSCFQLGSFNGMVCLRELPFLKSEKNTVNVCLVSTAYFMDLCYIYIPKLLT